MTRGPRKKLPAPVAYTTAPSPLARDIMLLGLARDLSTPSPRIRDLEPRRYDADLHHREGDIREVMAATHIGLVRQGYTVNAIPGGGAVVHRVTEADLPPRLQQQLLRWTPPPTSPASQGCHRSTLPWLLLARCPKHARALRVSGKQDMLLLRSKHRQVPPGATVTGRVTDITTAGRAQSHLAEMGQAVWSRYRRHHTEADRATAPDFGVTAALAGVGLKGTQQYLQRGEAFTELRWSQGTPWLSLMLVTSGGLMTRYAIQLPIISEAQVLTPQSPRRCLASSA